MSAPAFTAGPWKLDAEDPRYIRSVKTKEYIACRQSSNPADGPLLRAAPKLYEALAYAVDNPDFDSSEFDRLARAALAKAVP